MEHILAFEDVILNFDPVKFALLSIYKWFIKYDVIDLSIIKISKNDHIKRFSFQTHSYKF